ncbi:MAG: sodium:solute symporter family protein, partial [Deferribacterota bacterium]|nr:sodium:solute symporter family protein [Deferribacterota bacterium]
MLSIGLVANKFIKNEIDFLLASRRVSFIFLVFTMAATHFGGGFITGSIEYTIIYGTGGGIWYGLSCGLGLILLSFLAPKLRSLSLFTAPEYLEIRYGSKFIRVYAALTSLIALIGILSAQIIATSKLLGILNINPIIGGVVAVTIF